MFEFIRGFVADTGMDYLAIDVNGIGFKIYTSLASIGACTNGEIVTFYTHLSVTEDDMRLFGFVTKDELNMFEMLISVSGVGPKMGISILSGMNFRDVSLAISSGNFKALTKAKGVGAKLAQKIVVELKDKISVSDGNDDIMWNETSGSAGNEIIDEAIEALVSLGISPQTAKSKVTKVYKDGIDAGNLVKLALKG